MSAVLVVGRRTPEQIARTKVEHRGQVQQKPPEVRTHLGFRLSVPVPDFVRLHTLPLGLLRTSKRRSPLPDAAVGIPRLAAGVLRWEEGLVSLWNAEGDAGVPGMQFVCDGHR